MSGASRRGITEDKSKRIGEGAAYLSRFWRQFMACPGARERGTARREAGKNIWRARTRSASGGRRRRRGKAVGERSIRCVHAAHDVDPGGLPLPKSSGPRFSLFDLFSLRDRTATVQPRSDVRIIGGTIPPHVSADRTFLCSPEWITCLVGRVKFFCKNFLAFSPLI